MEIPILIWLIVQPYGKLNPSRKEKMWKLIWPLKDLKGSSVWKGSAGGSFATFAPLLLNMAIFDLKASSWWIKMEKDITVTSSIFPSFSFLKPVHQGNDTNTHDDKYLHIQEKEKLWTTDSITGRRLIHFLCWSKNSKGAGLKWGSFVLITQFWNLYFKCKYTRLVLSLRWATRDTLMISSPHSWSLRSPSRQIHRSSPAGCWSCRHWGHSVRCCTAQWSLSAPSGRPGSASV